MRLSVFSFSKQDAKERGNYLAEQSQEHGQTMNIQLENKHIQVPALVYAINRL